MLLDREYAVVDLCLNGLKARSFIGGSSGRPDFGTVKGVYAGTWLEVDVDGGSWPTA